MSEPRRHLFQHDGGPRDTYERRYCTCGLVEIHTRHELQRHDDQTGRAILGETNDSEAGQ